MKKLDTRVTGDTTRAPVQLAGQVLGASCKRTAVGHFEICCWCVPVLTPNSIQLDMQDVSQILPSESNIEINMSKRARCRGCLTLQVAAACPLPACAIKNLVPAGAVWRSPLYPPLPFHVCISQAYSCHLTMKRSWPGGTLMSYEPSVSTPMLLLRSTLV